MKLLSAGTLCALALVPAISSRAQVLWQTDFETPVEWFDGYSANPPCTLVVTNMDAGPPQGHILAVQFDSTSQTQQWYVQVSFPVWNTSAVSFDPAHSFLKCDLLVSQLRPVHLRVEYVQPLVYAKDLDIHVTPTTTNVFQTFLLPLTTFTSTLWVDGPVVDSPTAVDIYMEGDPAHPDTTWPSAPDNVIMADNLAYIVCPPLSIAAVDADNVLLSWPTNTSGFVLQQTTGLTPTDWSIVTNAPVLTNGIMQVVLPAGPGQDFYRLIGP